MNDDHEERIVDLEDSKNLHDERIYDLEDKQETLESEVNACTDEHREMKLDIKNILEDQDEMIIAYNDEHKDMKQNVVDLQQNVVNLQEGQESTTKLMGELKEKQSYQDQTMSSLVENLKVIGKNYETNCLRDDKTTNHSFALSFRI